ncbi:MAG: hypothetical protein ABIP51_18475 [Bacteroidia bacterium]
MANYVGKREQDAIIKYNNKRTKPALREQLYKDIIYPAFKKLAEKVIYNRNQKLNDPYNDYMDDCISHLNDIMPKFDPTRGNAFNFFNYATNTWVLQEFVVKKKKFVPIVQVFRKDTNDNAMGADENTLGRQASGALDKRFCDTSYEDIMEDPDDFFVFIQKKLAKMIVNTEDRKEQTFLRHMIMILENKNNIDEISNKKELYIILRTLTDFKAREITKFISKLKVLYIDFKKEYIIKHGF